MLLYVKHLNKFAQYLRRGACALLLALLASSRAQAENITVPTPRDRAEPLVPRVPPPLIHRPLLLSHHRPLFLHLAPAGLAVLAVFSRGGVGGWLFAFWDFPPAFLGSLLLPLPAPLGLPAFTLDYV